MTLPQGFIEYIGRYSEFDGLTQALITEPHVAVRVNVGKGVDVPTGAVGVPWCATGFYLPKRPQFTFDPCMHQGLYYVQDASSMAVGEAVARVVADFGRPVRLLDACAAPGGKTTAAIDALPPESFVVTNEYDFRRATVLAENIAKWGFPSCVVSRGDTAKFTAMTDFFDIVLADVPCSGEGMMRKDEDAVKQWSPALVADCASLQREIVANLWQALRPGGVIIYSTCTFNRAENEENVSYIIESLGGESIDLGIDAFPGVLRGIDTPYFCYRFLPSRIEGEGLFISAIRKPGDVSAPPTRFKAPKDSSPDKQLAPHASALKQMLSSKATFCIADDRIYAKPAHCAAEIDYCRSRLDVVSFGVPMATIKGRDLLPLQHLALSQSFDAKAFPQVDVDYHTAMAFLQRQAITLPDTAPRGIVLLSYAGRPLGFVKNIGRHANNLYPDSWRVLSSHIPSAAPSVLDV